MSDDVKMQREIAEAQALSEPVAKLLDALDERLALHHDTTAHDLLNRLRAALSAAPAPSAPPAEPVHLGEPDALPPRCAHCGAYGGVSAARPEAPMSAPYRGECGRHLWRSHDPDDACPACIDEVLHGRPDLVDEHQRGAE